MKAGGSEYLGWAKTRKVMPFNLATSGVMDYPIAELRAHIEDITICGPGGYGYPPLREAIAAKCGVSPDCVVEASGTSALLYSHG